MTKIVSFSILLITLMQSACTSILWHDGISHVSAVQKETHISDEQNEYLWGFTTLHNKQLLFLGNNHWYVIRADVSAPLLSALTAPLSQRYQIVAPYTGQTWQQLPVVMHTNQQFNSEFCLHYHAQNTSEITILQNMKFQAQKNPQHYRQCFAVVGEIYAAPNDATPRTFAHAVPIRLIHTQTVQHIRPSKMARNVLLTPAALTVDVASGAMLLPFLLANDARQLPKKLKTIDATQ